MRTAHHATPSKREEGESNPSASSQEQGAQVEGHALSGQFPGSASREGSDDGTKFDTAGGHRHRCQCYPGIGHWNGLKRVAPNVVPHKEAVPPSGLPPM